jgi:hypothetical protein
MGASVEVGDVPVVSVAVGVVCPWFLSSLYVFSDGATASRMSVRFSDEKESLTMALCVTRDALLDPPAGIVINQE